jgi:hypothetical protein
MFPTDFQIGGSTAVAHDHTLNSRVVVHLLLSFQEYWCPIFIIFRYTYLKQYLLFLVVLGFIKGPPGYFTLNQASALPLEPLHQSLKQYIFSFTYCIGNSKSQCIKLTPSQFVLSNQVAILCRMDNYG